MRNVARVIHRLGSEVTAVSPRGGVPADPSAAASIHMAKSHLRVVAPTEVKRTAFIEAARDNRYGHRETHVAARLRVRSRQQRARHPADPELARSITSTAVYTALAQIDSKTLAGLSSGALQALARDATGSAETVLAAEGISIGELATLVMDGLAKRRSIVTYVGGRDEIVVWIRITEKGQAALAK